MAGLQYMHAHNVAHRDLKLENFLISAEKVSMLADFGFAARVKVANDVPLTQMMKQTLCGTNVCNVALMSVIIYINSFSPKGLHGSGTVPKD